MGEEADGNELGDGTHRSGFHWSMIVYHEISYTVIVMSLRPVRQLGLFGLYPGNLQIHNFNYRPKDLVYSALESPQYTSGRSTIRCLVSHKSSCHQ